MCEKSVQNAKNLADILPSPRHSNVAHEAAKDMIYCNGRHILFVLDGWDELPRNAPGRSLLLEIIKSEVLPECSTIVTSRPIGSLELHQYFSA